MPFHSLLDCLMPSRSRTRTPWVTPQSKTSRLAVETLEDRCTPAAVLTIGDVTVLEGNEGTRNAAVTVSLTEPHSNSVSVDYTTADGSATAGTDYRVVSGKLTFTKNEMSKSIQVPIIGDRVPEPDRSFSVQLSNPKGGAKIADGSGLVTIRDDEPRVSINDVSTVEGNSNTTSFKFTVSLSAAYDRAVTVHYDTANGSAIAGLDYVGQSGTVTFNAGQTTPQEITVEVNGDQTPELNKTFFVNLSTPDSHTQINRGVGVGTIVDDEPRISIGDAYQDYYGSTITFTVSLAAPSTQMVTVDFTTVDGSALAGSELDGGDYIAQSKTLTFNPGDTVQMITIQLLAQDPADKYFSIHLSNASDNALLSNEWANGYWYYDYGYYYDPGYWYDPGYYW